ncbi:hypothetical protein [Pedobacter steynii]|uniref:Uncharacterized protein n=1 Tax=Pedobacter steynii TaxID=430522 RepID=A0A1D7QE42_9SPHI|nr:hypothetical protein [Pedobacter steynii]AOM76920.1 hypothetical protein BFS30_06895 [Pedobacter steynii]
MNMIEKSLVTSYKKGIDNQEYIYSIVDVKRNLVFEIKRNCLVFFFFLFSRRNKSLDRNKFKIINGAHQNRILSEAEGTPVLIGSSLVNISKTTLSGSLFSFFSLREISGLFFSSLSLYIKANRRGFPADALEFTAIQKMFRKFSPVSIEISGHFDRYSTWIGYLAEAYNSNLTISQHGCVASEALPYKIPCTSLKAFNEDEARCFEQYIIEKRNGFLLTIKGLYSAVKFVKFDNQSNQKLIAIPTGVDHLKEGMVEVIKGIRKSDANAIIFLYIHPTGDLNNFAALKQYDVVFCRKERYENIDILITYFSSLVYDYQSIGFKGRIICFQDDQTINRIPAMFSNENVHLCTSVNKILEYVS